MMTLFVVRHQHSEGLCPAKDPEHGAGLLTYLSRPNVSQHGVRIQGEAIVRGEHTLYLIADAVDEEHLREFMHPFEEAGKVDIYPASTCARVVTNGGCAAPEPEPATAPVLDPEDACQEAIEAGLVVHRANPLNAETPVTALIGGVAMPSARFYIRNHFPTPLLDAERYRLRVSGLVRSPLSLGLRELESFRSKSLTVTLECAGNGRSLFGVPTPGEKWGLGAASTAEWTGVPLREVLEKAHVDSRAREVLFRGADSGNVEGHEGTVRFERSLPLDDALDEDVLLAYAMNGEPLPVQHGAPLRLIVPKLYAVASVKWLTEIELIERPFEGVYQTGKYWYEWERDGKLVREPVTLKAVRALITDPAPEREVPRGELTVRGLAWSGAAPIARVEVAVGDGDYREARLLGARKRLGWQRFELVTQVEPGPCVLRARASDLAGRTQPEHAEWNRLGYGNNSVQVVPIRVS